MNKMLEFFRDMIAIALSLGSLSYIGKNLFNMLLNQAYSPWELLLSFVVIWVVGSYYPGLQRIRWVALAMIVLPIGITMFFNS